MRGRGSRDSGQNLITSDFPQILSSFQPSQLWNMGQGHATVSSIAPRLFSTLNLYISTNWFQFLDWCCVVQPTPAIPSDLPVPSLRSSEGALNPHGRGARTSQNEPWTHADANLDAPLHRCCTWCFLYTRPPTIWLTLSASQCRRGHRCIRLQTKPSTSSDPWTQERGAAGF